MRRYWINTPQRIAVFFALMVAAILFGVMTAWSGESRFWLGIILCPLLAVYFLFLAWSVVLAR